MGAAFCNVKSGAVPSAGSLLPAVSPGNASVTEPSSSAGGCSAGTLSGTDEEGAEEESTVLSGTVSSGLGTESAVSSVKPFGVTDDAMPEVEDETDGCTNATAGNDILNATLPATTAAMIFFFRTNSHLPLLFQNNDDLIFIPMIVTN